MLLLCISPNALASGWVALERSTAVHRDPSKRPPLTAPLADCDLPDTLRRYKYLDFREESEAVFAEILTRLPVRSGRSARHEAAPKKKPSKKKVKRKKETEPLPCWNEN